MNEIKDSKAVEAITKVIGEMNGAVFLFPPFLLLLPFFFLFWATEMLEPISPIACQQIFAEALPEEELEIRRVLCAHKGRPRGFHLWRLRNALRKAAQNRLEEAALHELGVKAQ